MSMSQSGRYTVMTLKLTYGFAGMMAEKLPEPAAGSATRIAKLTHIALFDEAFIGSVALLPEKVNKALAQYLKLVGEESPFPARTITSAILIQTEKILDGLENAELRKQQWRGIRKKKIVMLNSLLNELKTLDAILHQKIDSEDYGLDAAAQFERVLKELAA